MNISTHTGTYIGILAIMMWSVSSALLMNLASVPVFLLTTTTFSIATLIGFTYNRFAFRGQKIHVPFKALLVGTLGVWGHLVFFIISIRMIPFEHAYLTSYLWPGMMSIFAYVILKERYNPWHFTAMLLGFIGVAILSFSDSSSAILIIDWYYFVGISVAFMSAFVWGLYTVLTKKWHVHSTYSVVQYCLVGSILSFATHILIEPEYTINIKEFISLALLACSGYGLAYFCWDLGAKHGNYKTLARLSYMIPINTLALLILLGYAEFRYALIVSTLIVVTANIIGQRGER